MSVFVSNKRVCVAPGRALPFLKLEPARSRRRGRRDPPKGGRGSRRRVLGLAFMCRKMAHFPSKYVLLIRWVARKFSAGLLNIIPQHFSSGCQRPNRQRSLITTTRVRTLCLSFLLTLHPIYDIEMPLSRSPILRYFALIPSSVTGWYAYTYIANPRAAQEIFEFDHLPSGSDEYIFHALMGLLGAKAIFITFALYLAIFFAKPKYVAVTLLATAGMAYIDGYVVKTYVGHGEWNHWGYATGLVVYGLVLMGILDGIL
jgi:hypothetical protein